MRYTRKEMIRRARRRWKSRRVWSLRRGHYWIAPDSSLFMIPFTQHYDYAEMLLDRGDTRTNAEGLLYRLGFSRTTYVGNWIEISCDALARPIKKMLLEWKEQDEHRSVDVLAQDGLRTL